jgi:hypothetical protein
MCKTTTRNEFQLNWSEEINKKEVKPLDLKIEKNTNVWTKLKRTRKKNSKEVLYLLIDEITMGFMQWYNYCELSFRIDVFCFGMGLRVV